MNKIANYFKESYLELQEKVTWPTWANLQQSTVIVLVATAVMITVATKTITVLCCKLAQVGQVTFSCNSK